MKNSYRTKVATVILKAFNSLLISLLALLGVACDKIGGATCEYGSPYANFDIKGKVTDEQNNPVPNARVLVKTKDIVSEFFACDTLYTDRDGLFELQKSDFPVNGYRFITSQDPANDKNRLANDTTWLAFGKNDYKGGQNWFEGTVEKNIQITLKKYVDKHTSPYTLYTIYGRITDTKGNPIAGVQLTTLPAYTLSDPKDPSSFPAITDQNGYYSFTFDRATAVKHTIYASLYMGWWNWETYYSDNAEVDFADIELTEGEGLLIGKGKKELNFVLRDKAFKE